MVYHGATSRAAEASVLSTSHTFSGNPLDRGDRERRDDEWIARRSGDAASRFLPMRDLNVPVSEADGAGLVWLSGEERERLELTAQPLFLGLLNGTAHFVVDVSKADGAARELDQDGRFRYVDARSATELLDAASCGIVAQARAQVDWHARNGFCPQCGSTTTMARGGQTRHCPGCGAIHYPRTDPVVITAVHSGDWCLLGQSRGRGTGSNRYSALAGFVDQGESIEEAVAREIMEESGIAVKNVRYHSSQPWPFPSSLMIGCLAEAATTEISADDEEMSDVRWFHRDVVVSALDGGSNELTLPAPLAIAHHIIRAWALPHSQD